MGFKPRHLPWSSTPITANLRGTESDLFDPMNDRAGPFIGLVVSGIDLIGAFGHGQLHPREDPVCGRWTEFIALAGGIEEQQTAYTNLERVREPLPEALWNRSNRSHNVLLVLGVNPPHEDASVPSRKERRRHQLVSEDEAFTGSDFQHAEVVIHAANRP
jgi:hypothetical protein